MAKNLGPPTVGPVDSFSVDQAVSDADTPIVRSALAASQLFDSVTVVAEDIDILILLTELGRKQLNVFFLNH